MKHEPAQPQDIKGQGLGTAGLVDYQAGSVPPAAEAACKQAEDECPVDAIALEP